MPCRATGQQTRLSERAGQKIILQRKLPDLRMKGLHVDCRLRLSLRGCAEYSGRTLQQLVSPLLDLVRVNVEILRQLDQGFLALDRSHRDFRLEAGLWFRRGRLVMIFSSLAAIMPPLRGKSTYPDCSDFPNHLFGRGIRSSASGTRAASAFRGAQRLVASLRRRAVILLGTPVPPGSG